MPTLYFPCPQCDRPLDADPALDGPTVQCPCCDRVVDVPRPRALGRPVTVWLAAALTALAPASWAVGLLEFFPAYAVVPAVGVGTLICLIPAVALVRGKRAGWGMGLGVGCTSAALGLAGTTFAAPIVLVMGMDPFVFADALLIGIDAGGLLGLLMVPAVRAWCDR